MYCKFVLRKPPNAKPGRYQQGVEKDSDTENDRNNGLRMRNEKTMKEKRFSFFADPQERKTVSRPTFGTLPFAQHTSQRFAKVKEPNFTQPIYIKKKYLRLTDDTLANIAIVPRIIKIIFPILGT